MRINRFSAASLSPRPPFVRPKWLLWPVVFAGVCFFSRCQSSPAADTGPPLLIAGAANLRPALAALAHHFTDSTGYQTTLVFASSGKLTAQIRAGAPYDIFLSADSLYPATLAAADQLQGAARPFARSSLALWYADTSCCPPLTAAWAATLTRIAIANPATAPYGKAAAAYLRRHGLEHKLRAKTIVGESVGQVNQFVMTGVVTAGFTALASVGGDTPPRGTLCPLPQAPELVQTAARLRGGQQPAGAAAFMDFLLAPAGQRILQKFGYLGFS